MFVLCPHCHFLVGIDPRTGKPPAACPKCGGVVVEPLPDMPAEGVRAEEVPAPLAPFAPVELPSVLPTLPEVEAVAEPRQDEQMQLPVQAPAPAAPITEEAVAVEAPSPAASTAIEPAATPAPKPRSLLRRKAEPAVVPAPATPAVATPEPKPRFWSRRKTEPAAPAPTPATPAAATPEPKPRWWSRRKAEPATSPAASTPAAATEAAAPADPADPNRSDAMISALQGRRRTVRKSVATSVPPIQPAPVAPAVVESEVEVDALPPAVQIEDVIATSTADAGIESPAEAPASPPKRNRRTAPSPAADADRPATAAASIESTAAAGTPVIVPMDRTPIDSRPVDSAPAASTIADSVPADLPIPPHPLRRRTDFDPNAIAEPVNDNVPPHPLRRRTDAPSFTRPRVRASAVSRISWRSLAVAGGLSLLLALQLLLAQRDTLAASPRWRPTIAAMCATLRCSLPPWREPAAFTMLSRDVRPHPGAPGALLINASFRNDARWPQPWPRLLLTLSDLDGRMVGARSFGADDYLGAAPTQSELAPGQTAAITLSVVEPAPNIVAFTFDFR